MSPIVDLAGKRGLVVGIANDHSIAAGCATAFRQAGAELTVIYLNEKALPFVQPVAEALEASIVVPCDVRIPGQLEAVFARIERDWGRLDLPRKPSVKMNIVGSSAMCGCSGAPPNRTVA